MIITPYSEVKKGGDSSTIATEFPACKLFCPFDDGSGQTPREVVSDGVLDLSSSSIDFDWTTNANAITLNNGFSVTNIALPQAIPVGANSALLVAIGSGATISNIILQDSANATLLKLDIDSGTHTVQTAEGSSTPSIAASAAVVGHGVQFVSGIANEGRAYQAAEAAVVTPVLEDGTADLTTMADLEKITWDAIVAAGVWYSLQVWVFSSYAPTDAEIGTMLAWSLNSHINGDKYLYPAWSGKT